MNAKTQWVAATIAAAIATTMLQSQAWAQEEEPMTRTQVIAELNAARASGELDALNGEDSGSAWLARQPRGAGKTRAEVRAELNAARTSGELHAMHGEDSGSAYFAALDRPTRLARAEVVAELARARESGELAALHGEDSGARFMNRRLPERGPVYARGGSTIQ